MKKSIIGIICVAALLTVMLIGCGPKVIDQDTNSRVKIKFDGGYSAVYQIIEVDGTEYIAPLNGGITPLIKSDSKNGN
jgi:hypothetical protein